MNQKGQKAITNKFTFIDVIETSLKLYNIVSMGSMSSFLLDAILCSWKQVGASLFMVNVYLECQIISLSLTFKPCHLFMDGKNQHVCHGNAEYGSNVVGSTCENLLHI